MAHPAPVSAASHRSPRVAGRCRNPTRSGARSHHRDWGACARLELTHLLRGLDERADLRRRIMRRDVLCLVTEEQLAILEVDAGNPQPMTVRASYRERESTEILPDTGARAHAR